MAGGDPDSQDARLDDALRHALQEQAWKPGRDPERIGSYRIVRRLGRGGMGTVYLAEHVDLGRRVAVKALHAGLHFLGDARKRFWREALAVSRLDHPGICHLYEVGEEAGMPFLAMRYVEGVPLSEGIATALDAAPALPGLIPADSRAAVLRVAELIEKAARALHVAHESGLVHRDIKPSNLMVTPDGEPVLLDFGVARDESSQEALTLTGDLVGTPPYMAPEQLTGDRGAVDRRTDVYALGMTLYEALTLTRPFEGASHSETIQRVLTRDPPDPRRVNPAIPRELRVVMAMALDKDRDRRYRTALALAEDLRRVRVHEPIAARAPGPVLRVFRWTQRNPLAAAFIAILAVGALAVGTLWSEAARNLANFEVTATRLRLDQSRVDAALLFPSVPDMAPRLRAWLTDVARPLLERRDTVRVKLAGIEAEARGDDVREFLRGALRELAKDLDRFATQDVPDVERRLQWSEAVVRRTITDQRAAWDAAIASIKDPDQCPYAGLTIAPQLGLVPLGRNPRSQLWEFVTLETGEAPRRDEQTGRLELTEATGVVLVLVPGGRFVMGHDGEAVPLMERPEHEVELQPFFISKYELTQAQWARIDDGRNPSRLRPDRWPQVRNAPPDLDLSVTPLHPVESVTAEACMTVLHRVGLALPTEAQWEYAARAGTTGLWYTGPKPASLEGHANLSDQSMERAGLQFRGVAWDDGRPFHAPVGTYRPNPFGLHDVLGNVQEWCGDWRGWYDEPVEPGTGRRLGTERTSRVLRGGSFGSTAQGAYMARRQPQNAGSTAGDNIGCRPARALDR